MDTKYVKMAIVAAWIAGLTAYALAFTITSWGGWAFLIGVGALPPAIMLWLWAPAGQTMSQSIQEALTGPAFPKSRPRS